MVRPTIALPSPFYGFAMSALLLAGCAATPPAAPGPRSDAARYEGDVVIDPVTRALQAAWHITFTTDSITRDSATLLLNSGLEVTRLSGPNISSFTDTTTSDARMLVLRFDAAQRAGTRLSFDIAYSGTPVFGEDSINGIRADWIELGLDSYWHPVFQGYRQRIISTWRVQLPSAWQGVASGTTSSNGTTLTFQNSTPLIDLAFSAAARMNRLRTDAASVYYVRTDSATVARVLSTAGSCATYLNARFGTRDALPHAKIVIAPRKGPGYARQNYIVITDVSGFSDAELARFLCHEFSHYWSSGANSTGAENWLNEAFAEFVAGRYIRDELGAEAYAKVLEQWQQAAQDKAPVWTAALNRRPGPRIAYRKAPFLLDALERRIGSDKMNQVLARYMTERLSTTSALLQAIANVAGQSDADWFREQLAR